MGRTWRFCPCSELSYDHAVMLDGSKLRVLDCTYAKVSETIHSRR